MDRLGIECIVQYVGQPEASRVEARDFIRKHFEQAKGSAAESYSSDSSAFK
ncbi:MAG: hypothetical protein ACRD1R_15270 [Acidobacteriota bacterium]